MFDLLQEASVRSINPVLFTWGLGLIYCTGFILLASVALKFLEYFKNPQPPIEHYKHSFSTREMIICVLALFPFWVNSIGQISMETKLQYVYFGVGSGLIVCGVVWHLWAKINIRLMWSDGIEIKRNNQLVTSGAYALSRHPMYASLLLWCWGASFVMLNWVTTSLVISILLPLMIRRAKAEEKVVSKIHPEYALYQRNVHMLTPTIGGTCAVAIKVIAIVLFGYYIWSGLHTPSMLLLFLIHLYLGYSLTPEKVAFSYRSKSGTMLIFWSLSLIWYPLYYLLYVALVMFVYGLRFDCPCMIVYNKYNRCPCFSFIEKLLSKKST